MVSKIPDNILMERELTDDQTKIFISQINRFNQLSELNKVSSDPNLNSSGRLLFSKGTLIHGIDNFDYDKLDSISKSGILTGQAVGISEDGETYYCADFHRVKDDISVLEYNSWFHYNDGRCPFGKRADISRSVAFIIVPDDESKELLSYDCYRDTSEGLVTRSFVNTMPLVDDKSVASSILYGVPANCFNGIVLGGKIVNDREKIEYLINKFPNCYITTCFGDILYNPNKKEVTMEEYRELSREVAINNSFRRLNDKYLSQKDKEIENLQEENKKLMESMFKVLSNEDIRSILMVMGWQSVNNDYIENQRKGVSR